MSKFFVLSFLVPTFLFAQFCSTPQLVVEGNALIKKPADFAIITVGVVSESEEAQGALSDNSKKMHVVIDTLKGFGFEKTEFETGRFQLSPQYSLRPKNADLHWKPQIIGYQVTNTLRIKSAMLKRLGELVDALNKAGVNQIDHIQFTLKDPRGYRNEAIKAATKHALEDAKTLAAAAQVDLGKLTYISLDQSDLNTPVTRSFPLMAKQEALPQFEPGDIEISASVKVTYELVSSGI